ncbi:CBN-INS-1 protein [Aphelenchoides bicaudatus]|nr:CBN-INS-1 protein [Aphelenchoides bicaudatus]
MSIKYLNKVLASIVFILLIAQNYRTEANMRICGYKIVSTLKMICRNQVCGGGIAQEFSRKRSISDVALAMEQQALQPAISVDRRRDWYQVGRSNDEPRRFKRDVGGIATNCCKQRCSYKYLKTFCC